jgi:hypothetical protein
MDTAMMDWFDRFAAAQLARCDRTWDRAATHIAAAADPEIRKQIKLQGEILLAPTVIGGLDEQASLVRTVRGNAMGRKKPRLDELDRDTGNL